ncbi:MAG TPA: glycosyltransferase [Bryobacteraceae bacterium]
MFLVTAMRIMFVVPGDPSDQPGTNMIFVRRQAESLQKEGLEVDSFYLRSRTSARVLAREFRRFRTELERFDPAVVHAHYGTMTALFAALAAGRRPLVITYRGSDLNGSLRVSRCRSLLGRLLSQAAALRAARIVCVSRGLQQCLWWRRGKVTVLPSGVDAEVFHPEPRSAARARLGWPEGDRVVLFNAGRDPRTKRLDLAIEAVEVARQTLPGLRLEVMSGQTGPDQVPTWMNASDCLLVTSDTEGSPTVVQEALACGLPVVSVEVGDIVERLDRITNTRVVARDARVIGAALVELIREPLRTNGPESARGLSLGRIAGRLRDLYAEVCGLS